MASNGEAQKQSFTIRQDAILAPKAASVFDFNASEKASGGDGGGSAAAKAAACAKAPRAAQAKQKAYVPRTADSSKSEPRKQRRKLADLGNYDQDGRKRVKLNKFLRSFFLAPNSYVFRSFLIF